MTRRRPPPIGWAFVALAVVAFAVRLVVWARASGPTSAVDSVTYFTFARAIAHGDFREFGRLPFYALYPLTLAPMYGLSLPEAVYIKWLHVVASTATVLLLFRIGEQVMSKRGAVLLGAAASIYPFFLFWLPYVLTETLFLLCLAAYALAYLRLVDAPRASTLIGYLIVCGLFLLSRPSAVVCVAASWLALGSFLAVSRWGAMKGMAVVATGAVLVVAAATFAITLSPALQSRLLSMPTIGQTLWASTRTSVGNFEELRRLEVLDQEMHRRFVGPDRERNEYAFKVREAAQFIVDHPVVYARMVVSKAIGYWFPWIFSTTWSAAHRVMDAIISIALAAGVILAARRRAMAPRPMVALAAMAGSFVLLSSFGQIDPDARYRLPAELLALILAVAGFTAGDSSGRAAARG